MNFKKTVILKLLLMFSTKSFCNNFDKNHLIRSLPVVSTINSIEYSKSSFPQKICPNNSKIFLIQSPGLKFFFCDLLQTSITGSSISDVCFTMTIQNKFGGRFCNSEIGQMFLTIFSCIIFQKVKPSWELYLTNNSVGQNNSKITTTSSGISTLLTVPYTNADKAIDAFGEIYLMIKNMNITNQDIKNAFNYSINICLNDSLTTKDFNTIATTPSSSHWMGLCDPKLDISEDTSHNTKANIGFILGGSNIFDAQLINSWNNLSISKFYIQHLHLLIQSERSFILFGASAQSSLISNLEALTARFSKIVLPTHLEFFHKPKYGYILSKGLNISVDQANTTIPKGVGGVITLGPLNKDTLLASAMILKLIKANSLNISSGYIGVQISPFGGMLQVRISSSESNLLGSPESAFDGIIDALSTRYTSSTNDSDFTNYTSIIDDLIKYFSPGSSNSTMYDIEKGIYPIYNDTPEAYVYWMELFYGAYNVLDQIQSLTTLSNLDKANEIKQSTIKVLNNLKNPPSNNVRILFY